MGRILSGRTMGEVNVRSLGKDGRTGTAPESLIPGGAFQPIQAVSNISIEDQARAPVTSTVIGVFEGIHNGISTAVANVEAHLQAESIRLEESLKKTEAATRVLHTHGHELVASLSSKFALLGDHSSASAAPHRPAVSEDPSTDTSSRTEHPSARSDTVAEATEFPLQSARSRGSQRFGLAESERHSAHSGVRGLPHTRSFNSFTVEQRVPEDTNWRCPSAITMLPNSVPVGTPSALAVGSLGASRRAPLPRPKARRQEDSGFCTPQEAEKIEVWLSRTAPRAAAVQ